MPRANAHYLERVNRVLDYIGEHLAEDLSLARLAEVGCFSPFHFHRVFQGITGETLNSHVRRVRLERAVLLLRSAPRKRITDVALETGFGGAAEFSRAFRQQYGRTASSWDRRTPLEISKIGKEPERMPYYTVEELEGWQREGKIPAGVQRIGAFRYVYIRVFEPYGSSRLVEAYHALLGWLSESEVATADVVFLGMSLDDPSVTPAKNCRYDMGVAFPLELGSDCLLAGILRDRGRTGAAVPQLPEGFSSREFEAQEAVALHCEGDIGQVGRAWQYLYRIWLPTAGYEPADRPAMEMFVRLPEEIGWQTFDLHTCIPVAPF